MADWQTISSLATGGGTLVLAVATFSAVRSSNRSARIAEESLRAGLRPLLIPSLAGDPVQKARWGDGHVAKVEGGRAIVEQEETVIYLALGLRNAGSGIALIHGWLPMEQHPFDDAPQTRPEDFRRQGLDLYVPAGGTGFWEAAIRDADDPLRPAVEKALANREPFRLDLLYATSKACSVRSAASLWCPQRTSGTDKQHGTGTWIVPIHDNPPEIARRRDYLPVHQ